MIGVFDSGIGGLSVWREIVRLLPYEQTVYLADQAHVPYGSRGMDEVRELAEGVTRFLLRRGAQVIVVACNTASAAALYYLRRTFPEVPFVGMEPAVKPAVERTRTGVVGVIATPTTFQGELFASLLARYGGEARVIPQVCPGLVEAVESLALDTARTEGLLRECLAPLMEAGADQLVLGCTHYPFLRAAIERVVGGRMAVIDPAPAVARQTGRVLARRGLTTVEGRPVSHHLYTTGDAVAFAATVARLLPDAPPVTVSAARWRGGVLSPTAPPSEQRIATSRDLVYNRER